MFELYGLDCLNTRPVEYFDLMKLFLDRKTDTSYQLEPYNYVCLFKSRLKTFAFVIFFLAIPIKIDISTVRSFPKECQ